VVSDELQLVGGKSPVNARSGQLNQVTVKENRTKIRIIFFLRAASSETLAGADP
jgi:hypothetical protein